MVFKAALGSESIYRGVPEDFKPITAHSLHLIVAGHLGLLVPALRAPPDQSFCLVQGKDRKVSA